jgi:DNA-binding LacI/PurR family transcriptional regulator
MVVASIGGDGSEFELASDLEEQGVSGGSARRPKIVDVAKAAGVSPTTVSHALNHRGQVDPRTRERVIEVARRLGYRPHLGAQRLRTGLARHIALISSMPFSIAGGPSRLGFFMEVASSAAETALTDGYALVLIPPLEILPSLDDLDIGGAVVVEPQQDDDVTQRLSERGVPVVSIGEQPAAEQRVPFVEMHAGYCSGLLLTHLQDAGARNIALVAGAQRRESYLAARREYETFTRRMGMAHRLVLVDEGEGEEGARRRMKELLDRAPEVDGVCAMVDTFATGVVRAIRESGRAVPVDVRVATRYDGIRARTSEPPLTAIDLHLQETATAAVELLLRVMSGEDAPPSVEVSLPILLPRASSAVVTTPGR